MKSTFKPCTISSRFKVIATKKFFVELVTYLLCDDDSGDGGGIGNIFTLALNLEYWKQKRFSGPKNWHFSEGSTAEMRVF